MDMDFVVTCPLVQRRMPPIRFLSIGSRLFSTLSSDPASRRRPCAGQTGQTEHIYGETSYAAKTWEYEWRVIIKAEVVRAEDQALLEAVGHSHAPKIDVCPIRIDPGRLSCCQA
jgi:hypothetical protein